MFYNANVFFGCADDIFECAIVECVNDVSEYIDNISSISIFSLSSIFPVTLLFIFLRKTRLIRIVMMKIPKLIVRTIMIMTIAGFFVLVVVVPGLVVFVAAVVVVAAVVAAVVVARGLYFPSLLPPPVNE